MIPVDQTRLHGENVKGNCFRACIASVLELSIDEVPAFEDMTIPYEWIDRCIEFLESHGYQYEGIYSLEDLRDCNGVDGYLVANGKSPRGDFKHSVIWKDGAIVHDPHPSRSGLDGGVTEFFLFSRYTSSS